jgi:cytochrome c peroxidase
MKAKWLKKNRAARRFCAAASAALTLALVLSACAARVAAPPDQATPAPPIAVATPLPLPAAAARVRPFPLQAVPADNPTTAATVELGRQLFFDPVLSASHSMSCATCHRPDLGFSNGAPVSTPRPGAPGRNVQTLWNTGFNRFLLWDGRETSLESQARLPLTLPNEMAETPAQLETTLRAIPAYVELFAQAFGGGDAAISFENVTRALAAFQRTLISDNSPVDRYLAGETDALAASQQRGLALFFDDRTHCAECHQPPTFAAEMFRVVGVESEDAGRAGVSPNGLRGAFKVPTLRNVALTAPYMHNGSLATLNDVIAFYAAGAGRVRSVPGVDPLLKGFDLNDQEQADLVAFLQGLTDESRLPVVPAQALSGLATVARQPRP